MATNTPANNFSVFSLLEALRRRKLLVIIPTVLLGLGFSLYAYKQPLRYKTQALLAAEHMTPPEYLKHVAPPAMNIKEHLWTVREVLYSPRVLETAARELKVYRDVPSPLPLEALDAMKSAINIRVETEHTFDISYEGTDRYEVTNVTNKLAELFVRQASADRQQKGEDITKVIDQELEQLKGRLDTQSKEIHNYKQGAVRELPDHVLENISMIDDLTRAYEEKGTKIAEDEARRTAIVKEMTELEAKGALERPMIAEKTPAELQLDQARIKVKQLQGQYRPGYPDLVQAERELSALERSVATQPKPRVEPSAMYLRHVALKSELDTIDQRVTAYRREQYSLSSQLGDYRARVARSPQHERALEGMQREYEVGNQQFHALLDKKLDSSVAQGLEKAESGIAFQVVEPASLPTAPFSPQRERIALMGIFAGLGLGLIMAFFVEQSDTTFGNVDDFQAFTSLPVAGVIPTAEQKNGIVTIVDPESVSAEQYRILAMKVQQQCEAQNANVLLITSAAGGEGKSLTAINLAMAMSSTVDGPVLLVDGDMRKPRIAEYLKVTATADTSFQGLLQKPEDDPTKYAVKVRNLDVIPGVATTGNPVAALASPKARDLMDRLKKSYKFVIIDAPPTLPIADSHILSGFADKVLFVVRARKTPRELFQHAVESFEAANLLGAVLNDVDYQRSRYAYAYEYYKEKAR